MPQEEGHSFLVTVQLPFRETHIDRILRSTIPGAVLQIEPMMSFIPDIAFGYNVSWSLL